MVGGCLAAEPLPTPPYQGGESFSWFLRARQRTGMNDCSENACAEGTLECGGLTPPSHRTEGTQSLSRTGAAAKMQGGVKPPHSKALRAFSCFLRARQGTGMSDCFE